MKPLKPSRFPRRNPNQRDFLKIYRALFGRYGLRHWWPAKTPFEVIVGAILTQNTAWKNVERAIRNLKAKRALSFSALRKITKRDLAQLIRPSGYFNVKAERLKAFTGYLWRNYRGSLARMFRTENFALREELLGIKGIGEETADSILLYAGRKPFFVVDAYTRRVFTRHRYLREGESYAAVQKIFTENLPKSISLYNDYHAQIVEVGKDYCRGIPRCADCPLRNYL